MRTDAVVCGAGIAGIAAAWHLIRRDGFDHVVLVERNGPLSLTSDKSTECFRNWWQGPGDTMVRFANRSIELLDALAQTTDNGFNMERRGYLYLSAERDKADTLAALAHESETLGAGALRVHDGGSAHASYRPGCPRPHEAHADGADLILHAQTLREHFPFASPECQFALHVRRAGTLSAQQLGMLLLEQARGSGVVLMRGDLHSVEIVNGEVRAVRVQRGQETLTLQTRNLINAAGPYLSDVAALAGIELPVHCERHLKLTFADRAGVFPRGAPLSIWCDDTRLAWSDAERDELAGHAETRYLTEPFPPGVHGRPIGRGDTATLYWTYDCPVEPPRFPIEADPHLAEILMRGMSVMVPGLSAYHEHIPAPYVDGGYYTKTPENRPLIGATAVAGFHLMGAFSGFGIMTAMAGGELLADHVSGSTLPDYAHALSVARYQDPGYDTLLASWPTSGQI